MMVEKISQNPPVGNFYRPAPSKWNNAEKWVLNRQNSNSNSNALRRLVGLGQSNVGHNTNSSELRAGNRNLQAVNTKRIDGVNPASNVFLERFSFQATQPSWVEAGQKELGTTTVPIDDLKGIYFNFHTKELLIFSFAFLPLLFWCIFFLIES